MNRRDFVHTVFLGTRGPSASAPASSAAAHTDIRLANNENPYGPGPCAIQAIGQMLARANRYPGSLSEDLASAVVDVHDVPRECVLLSGGSGDVMRAAVYAFTSPTRVW